MDRVHTIGRRKAAIARIYMSEGKGNIRVNKRPLEDYFPLGTFQYIVKQALAKLELSDKYDISANVSGGGNKGQAEAIRLAIARALVQINEEYKPTLKADGLLTRDSRIVERKKPGQPKARKKFQFSKR